MKSGACSGCCGWHVAWRFEITVKSGACSGCCGWHVAWRYEIMVKSGASTQHAQDVVAGMLPGDMKSR